MTLTIPTYKIVGERPLKLTAVKGGVRFEVWSFEKGDFVIGGANDWDVLMGGLVRKSPANASSHAAPARRVVRIAMQNQVR